MVSPCLLVDPWIYLGLALRCLRPRGTKEPFRYLHALGWRYTLKAVVIFHAFASEHTYLAMRSRNSKGSFLHMKNAGPLNTGTRLAGSRGSLREPCALQRTMRCNLSVVS